MCWSCWPLTDRNRVAHPVSVDAAASGDSPRRGQTGLVATGYDGRPATRHSGGTRYVAARLQAGCRNREPGRHAPEWRRATPGADVPLQEACKAHAARTGRLPWKSSKVKVLPRRRRKSSSTALRDHLHGAAGSGPSEQVELSDQPLAAGRHSRDRSSAVRRCFHRQSSCLVQSTCYRIGAQARRAASSMLYPGPGTAPLRFAEQMTLYRLGWWASKVRGTSLPRPDLRPEAVASTSTSMSLAL